MICGYYFRCVTLLIITVASYICGMTQSFKEKYAFYFTMLDILWYASFFLENDDIKVTKWGIGDNDDNVEKEECMVLDMVWFREEKFIALQLNSQWYRINIIFVLSILTSTKKRKCNVCLSGSGLSCVAYWSLVTSILLRVSGFHFCGWVIFHCVFIYYIFLKEDYTILIWVLFFFCKLCARCFSLLSIIFRICKIDRKSMTIFKLICS